MKYLITLVVLLLAKCVNAQSLQGVILDASSRKPVPYATITFKHKAAITNFDGKFGLSNIGVGDTLVVSFMGYKTHKFIVTNANLPLTIYLQPENILLNQVAIKGVRNFKADSLINRKWYSSAFDHRSVGFKDLFITRSPYARNDRPNNTSELISINALQVVGMLFKNKNRTSRLQKVLLKDEEDNYVDMVFSKTRVVAATGLKGDSLQNFMVQYRPTASEVKNMNTYDMWAYIKKSYRKFMNSDTIATLNK